MVVDERKVVRSMNASDEIRAYVKAHYIVPARRAGSKTVTVGVGEVHRALNWDLRRVPQVCAALATQKFQHFAHVELIAKEGPPSGQSTTVRFTYRLLDGRQEQPQLHEGTRTVKPNGAGLEALIGILSKEFAALGGGEVYLRAERDWGPDAWERLALEKQEKAPGKK